MGTALGLVSTVPALNGQSAGVIPPAFDSVVTDAGDQVVDDAGNTVILG